MDVSGKLTWNKTSNTTWETVGSRRESEYTAVITLGAKPNPYSITISGGGGTTTHATLAQAKNKFRKFLFTKPVRT